MVNPDRKELAAIARRFGDRKVAVVGDIVVDEYLYGQTDRISREAPVLIVRHESTERKLGGAGNAAANLASLGGKVLALGIIGDDEWGRSLESLCEEAGIESRLTVIEGGVTETKTRILAGGINTTRQQMLRLDRGRVGQLEPAAVDELVLAVRKAAAEADVTIVSDYGGGVMAPAVVEEIRRLAKEGARICVDSRYDLTSYTGVLVAKPNEPELATATQMPVGGPEDTIAAARELQRILGCGAVLATRGRSGMALIEGSAAPDLIPAHGKWEAVDVTGAGDTVIATFALSIAAGASLGQAARIANAAGALVVRKPGTATVSIDELLEELSS